MREKRGGRMEKGGMWLNASRGGKVLVLIANFT